MTSETRGTSAEQLAIAMMAKARSLFTLVDRNAVLLPSDLRTVADLLAQWATDARKLGVDHFHDVAALDGQKAALRERMTKAERRLGLVRAELTKLEMARSDDPLMALHPLLTVLAEFVEGIEAALNG